MKKADLGKRLIAYFIDGFLISAIVNIISIPFGCCMFFATALISGGGSSINAYSTRSAFASTSGFLLLMCATLILVALSFAVSYVYYIWYPVKRNGGATLGKKAMGIHIVRTSGAKVTISDMLMREWVGKLVSGFAFSLGYIWILIDEQGQGWHDKIADTLVVEDK